MSRIDEIKDEYYGRIYDYNDNEKSLVLAKRAVKDLLAEIDTLKLEVETAIGSNDSLREENTDLKARLNRTEEALKKLPKKLYLKRLNKKLKGNGYW